MEIEQVSGKKSKDIMDNLHLDASEEKKSLLYLLNANVSDADIGITSTSGPKKIQWQRDEKKGRRRKGLLDAIGFLDAIDLSDISLHKIRSWSDDDHIDKTEKILWRLVPLHSHFVFHIGVEKEGRRRKVFHSAQDLTDIQEYRYLKNAIRALKVPKALQAKNVPSEKHQRMKKELMERKMERYKEVVDALWTRNHLFYKEAVKSTNVVAQDDVHVTHEDAAANLAQDDEIIAQDESKINSTGLTVNLTKSSKNLTKEMHDVHGIQTLKSREIWSPSSIEAPFRVLSNIEIPHDGNQNGGASRGTITLICLKDGVYSALTCAHVACVTDHQQTFLDGERLVSISKAVETLNKHDENKYMYTPSKSDCKAEIGSSHRHTFAQFDSETDIMSINIGKQEDFKKLIGDEMEDVVLSLDDANEELQRRVEDNKEAVQVRAAKGVEGFISELNYEYWCKNSTRRIFQNAIKIKSCQTFFDSGDSGTLVWFLNEKKNWQPFAYGVCEVCDDGDSGSEKSYICLKLNHGLKALGLQNGQFFLLRDDGLSVSNSAKSSDGEGGAANKKDSKVTMKYLRNNHERRQASKCCVHQQPPSEKLKSMKLSPKDKEKNAVAPIENTDLISRAHQQPPSEKLKIIELSPKDNAKNPVTAEITDTDDFQFFKKKFLTDDFKMSNDVHDKLKSFDWFCGKCGTSDPTDQMPYLHLYMVVDYANGITDDNMKQKINKKFGWQASKYIEFRPNDPWKVRPLSNKRLGVERDDTPYVRSSGTLTMVHKKDGKQYALSCFHVGYEIGRIRNDDVNPFLAIQDEIKVDRKATQQFMQENKYYLSDDNEVVGNFSHFHFGRETDIMAIKVDEVKMEKTSDETENYSHDVFSELFNRKSLGKKTSVQKAEEISGEIEDLIFHFDDDDGRSVFHNAVLVKSDVKFLMDGDSGSLVYFCDENKKKRPFAYGVAELRKKYQNGKVETFYICLRLKDALKKLKLM